MANPEKIISPYDSPRKILIPGNAEETVMFCVRDLVDKAKKSIEANGSFNIALSGGSTPKVIYKSLANDYQDACDWSKVHIFWSDERCVSPEDPDSNYHMAMTNGLNELAILPEHIYRMPADAKDLKSAAESYEKKIREIVPNGAFDFIMLGMGDDGHTASLFPYTEAIHEKQKLVTENHVTQKSCWRMTFTYPCINNAKFVRFYVIGKNKSTVIEKVFGRVFDPDKYPSQGVGTHKNPSLWIADNDAASLFSKEFSS